MAEAADSMRWYHLDRSRTECVAGHDPQTRLCVESGGQVISEVEYLTQVLEITRGLLRDTERERSDAEYRANKAEAKLREIDAENRPEPSRTGGTDGE